MSLWQKDAYLLRDERGGGVVLAAQVLRIDKGPFALYASQVTFLRQKRKGPVDGDLAYPETFL